MPVDTDIEKLLDPEQEKKDTERFSNLNKKTDRTAEEDTELKSLKENYGKRVSARIDKLTAEKKVFEQKYGETSKRVEELEQEIVELKKDRKTEVQPIKTSKQTMTIGDKEYYTDDALLEMVKNEEISESNAWKHQRERDRAEDRFYIDERIEEKDQTKEAQNTLKNDIEKVLEKYPQFDKNHPKHDPTDPLYVQANEILKEFTNKRGQLITPRAFSKSIALAEKILGVKSKRPDVSDEHNFYSGTPPDKDNNGEKVSFSDDEKEIAWRMYRNVVNPKTGKTYNQAEALAKAEEAKKKKLAGRVK